MVQRVQQATVSTGGRRVSGIGEGLFVLLGVERGDDEAKASALAAKVSRLRVFPDHDGRLAKPPGNREILCVSQFTLLGDVTSGNRPGFSRAAGHDAAKPLYDFFCEKCEAKRGAFGEEMEIDLTLDGPVTILIET